MTEKKYYIKIHSIGRFITALIVIFCSLLIFTFDYIPSFKSEIISGVALIAILIISFYLADLVGMAKAKMILTEKGIVHIWERRFFLSSEKNLTIPWNIVDSYIYHVDTSFDSFTINLTNKTRYKINRLIVWPLKDDFKKLITEFPHLANEYRKHTAPDTDAKKITEGKSLYATKQFRWVFYSLTVVFSILLLSKIFKQNAQTSWSSLGAIGCALLFYGAMIREKRNS